MIPAETGVGELLRAALEYHTRGWCVLPIGRGKKPAVRAWKPFQTRRPTRDELAGLLQKDSVTGIAVIHGAVSGGVVCRDYDRLDAYKRWSDERPDLAATLPTVETVRGRHVYFRGPKMTVKLPDGEYRCTSGQYTLLPPSRHPNGPLYRWLIPLPSGALPEIPDPFMVGLMQQRDTERYREGQRGTEQTERTRRLPATSSRAGSFSMPHGIDQIILETLPSEPGQRHHKLFDFARRLKALPQFADADAKELRDVVKLWHAAALPFIGTKEFADTWDDFRDGWPRIRFPAGHDPLHVIVATAAAADPPTEVVSLGYGAQMQLLGAICRELQRANGEQPFFIACRKAAEHVGIDHGTASRWIRVLVSDGLLEEVEKGSKATRRASRYRWRGQL